MPLDKQLWTGELRKNFFNDDSFMSDGIDRSGDVAYDTIHDAQAGAPTHVISSPVYPLLRTKRIDTAVNYKLNTYATDVREISDEEAELLPYQKRQSMIMEDKAQLNERIGDEFLWSLGMPTSVNTNGVFFTASGTDTFTTMDGTNRTLKKFTEADAARLTMAFNMRKLPKANRVIMLSPDAYVEFVMGNEILRNQMALRGAIVNQAGQVGLTVDQVTMWGWTFKSRSGMADYTGDVANGFNKVPFGTLNVPTTAASCAVAYIAQKTWTKALGTTKMYDRIDDPEYQASWYSMRVRAGGYIQDDRTQALILLTP
jgi:hypothetical protein